MQKEKMREILGNPEKVVIHKTGCARPPFSHTPKHHDHLTTNECSMHGERWMHRHSLCAIALQQQHGRWRGKSLDIKKGTCFSPPCALPLTHWVTPSVTVTLILASIQSTALFLFLSLFTFFSLQPTTGAQAGQNSCWIHAAKIIRTASFPEEQLCTFPDGSSIFLLLQFIT